MYGHCLILLSPDGKDYRALLVVSRRQHYSAVTALKSRRDLWGDYKSWSIASFTTAYMDHPKARPTVVAAQLVEPGQLVDIEV